MAAHHAHTHIHTPSLPPETHLNLQDSHYGPRDFEKLRLLGRGAVGKVYLVRLKGTTNRLFGMKVLTKEEMIRKNKIKRVLTEREILATVAHPFIVSMFASFQTASRLYFVMEYCAGGEFFRLLQKQPDKRVSEDAARFYAAEVLLALEYLHMQGFIYRDLKPENVLVHESGHIMLTDFDLSKAMFAVTPEVVNAQKKKSIFSSAKDDPEIMDFEPRGRTNTFVGTDEYMAPEVVEGYGYAGSVDWWTLGILIYEMLYGTTPFKGESEKKTLDQVVHKELRFPDTPVVSEACKKLIKGLLKKDPEKRLGHEHGSWELKKHPWFKSIDWALIRNQKPPIVPQLLDPLDTRYFPDMKDNEDADDDLSIPDPEGRDPFARFRTENRLDMTAASSTSHISGAQSSSSRASSTSPFSSAFGKLATQTSASSGHSLGQSAGIRSASGVAAVGGTTATIPKSTNSSFKSPTQPPANNGGGFFSSRSPTPTSSSGFKTPTPSSSLNSSNTSFKSSTPTPPTTTATTTTTTSFKSPTPTNPNPNPNPNTTTTTTSSQQLKSPTPVNNNSNSSPNSKSPQSPESKSPPPLTSPSPMSLSPVPLNKASVLPKISRSPPPTLTAPRTVRANSGPISSSIPQMGFGQLFD